MVEDGCKIPFAWRFIFNYIFFFGFCYDVSQCFYILKKSSVGRGIIFSCRVFLDYINRGVFSFYKISKQDWYFNVWNYWFHFFLSEVEILGRVLNPCARWWQNKRFYLPKVTGTACWFFPDFGKQLQEPDADACIGQASLLLRLSDQPHAQIDLSAFVKTSFCGVFRSSVLRNRRSASQFWADSPRASNSKISGR